MRPTPEQLSAAYREAFGGDFESRGGTSRDRIWKFVELLTMPPEPITEARLAEIAIAMPGGLDGYPALWGLTQYARAVEREHGIGGAG